MDSSCEWLMAAHIEVDSRHGHVSLPTTAPWVQSVNIEQPVSARRSPRADCQIAPVTSGAAVAKLSGKPSAEITPTVRAHCHANRLCVFSRSNKRLVKSLPSRQPTSQNVGWCESDGRVLVVHTAPGVRAVELQVEDPGRAAVMGLAPSAGDCGIEP